MSETNVNITAGSGTGIDTFNVGTGAVGSGTEAIRQAMVIGDPTTKANVAAVDANGRLSVTINGSQLATYTAKLNTVATGVLTANSASNFMSFEHAATATKTVKIRRIIISGYTVTTVASPVTFQLQRGTAASTGGTTVVTAPTNPATSAAEVTVKSSPSLAIVAGGAILFSETLASVTTTANSLIPPFVFYDWQEGGETAPLTLRAGVLDTLVLSILCTGAVNATLNVSVVFTEE